MMTSIFFHVFACKNIYMLIILIRILQSVSMILQSVTMILQSVTMILQRYKCNNVNQQEAS